MSRFLDETGLAQVAGFVNKKASVFYGTKAEWDMLPLSEKQNYDYAAFNETGSGYDPKRKVVICVGDSYNKNTEWWDGWGKCLRDNYPSFEVYSYEAGGGGFVANTYEYNFLGALQNHSQDVEVQDKTSVTDIIVLGGYNDVSVSATDEQLKTAIGQFVSYCNVTYPNAKVTIAGICFDYNSAANQRKCNAMNMKYSTFATVAGAATHPHFKYILQAKFQIFFQDGNANSGFHPSTGGNTQVAADLAQYLRGGTFDVRYGYVVGGSFVYRHNDRISIMAGPADNKLYPNGRGIFDGMLDGKTLVFNTWTDMGTLEDINGECLLWGAEPGLEATWYSYILKQNSGGTATEFKSIVVFKIIDKHLYANNTGSTDTITLGTNGFVMTPGTLTFDWQEII